MKLRLTLFGLACCLLVAGCELFDNRDDVTEDVDYSNIENIRFSQHVQPLLDRKCTACHEGSEAAAGLRLDSWTHLIEGSAYGEAIIAFDTANSLLLELATQLEPPHPADVGAEPLTPEEVAFLKRWISEGARNDAGEVPYADAEDLLYVTNQDAGLVSVIDTEANVVVRTVELADFGFEGVPKPHHAAVEPDGSAWYISLIGANTVLKFNRKNELLAQSPFFETPGMLAVHPTEDLIYAGRSLSNTDAPPSIGVFRRSDLSAGGGEQGLVGVAVPRPHALHVSPDGRHVYTASLTRNLITTVETATHQPLVSGAFSGNGYLHFAVSHDGQTLYAAGHLYGEVHVIDASNPQQLVLEKVIPVDPQPWHPVLTPDGRFLYVGNKATNTVTVIDTETLEVVDEITGDGLAQPHGAAVSPDGRYVYITNNNTRGEYTPRYDLGNDDEIGTVVVIDTATRAIVKVLEVEENPTGAGIREVAHP